MHDNDAWIWTSTWTWIRALVLGRISFQTAEVYEISRELLMLVDGEIDFFSAMRQRFV